jgi:hypothetical protein
MSHEYRGHNKPNETRDSVYQRAREAGVPREAARDAANKATEAAYRNAERVTRGGDKGGDRGGR